MDIQRLFLPWWNKIKEEGHCSAKMQWWWHRQITSPGDWQVQQTSLLQKCKKISPPNAQQIPMHGWLCLLLRSFLFNWITRWGKKRKKSCFSLGNVLRTQEIPLLCKILKLYFPPQIAQAIYNRWIWGSSMLSNASTESIAYGRH